MLKPHICVVRRSSALQLQRRAKSVTTASAPPFDAIVVGGGHNGLVAANYLARAGKRVLVLERRALVGGAAVTEELIPGYKFSRASYVYSLFRPHIASDLRLAEHGLSLIPRVPSSFTPVPEAGGLSLTLGGGHAFDVASIGAHSKRDAAAWVNYNEDLERYCAIARHLLDVTPPFMRLVLDHQAPLAARCREAASMARLGCKALSILGPRIPDFLAFLTSPAAKILDSYFESDLLKATLATDSVIGAMTSTASPQSAYVLLHHCMTGSWFNVRGGMGAVSQALAAAATAAGVVIRVNSPVKRLLVESCPVDAAGAPAAARVVGVELLDGSQLRAPLVLSNLAPTTTLSAPASGGAAATRGLLPEAAEVLPLELRRSLAATDTSSAVVKINCAIDALPTFRCRLPQHDPALLAALGAGMPPAAAAAARGQPADTMHLRGTIHFEGSMGQIDAAYRDAAAGRPSARPIIELTLPSVLDPTLAPAGRHVALLLVQYAPYAHDWHAPGAREAFADRVFAVIDEYAPGFSASVRYRDILTPVDLEATFGLPGGNIFHSAMGLDQLFWSRPAPSVPAHRTPVRGLFLCGAGTHPGGGVIGAAGHNAAMAALRDEGWARGELRRVSSAPQLA